MESTSDFPEVTQPSKNRTQTSWLQVLPFNQTIAIQPGKTIYFGFYNKHRRTMITRPSQTVYLFSPIPPYPKGSEQLMG